MLERMWRNGNPLALLVGMQTGVAALEKSVEGPQKIKNRTTYDPAIALLGIYPRDTGVLMHEGMCTPVFIEALSTIAKLWKEPKCPSADEWIKKLWFIYTVEYYLATRKNEILVFAAMWKELEGIMLSEISQRRTDVICFHSYVDLEKLNRSPWRRGRGKNSFKQRLLNTENKLRVDGGSRGEGKMCDGH